MPGVNRMREWPLVRRALRSEPDEPGPTVALLPGSLQLLVLQPSPFCNLDCDYCYLPHRDDRRRMPLDLLERLIEQVLSSGLVGDTLSIVWHAGEPMAVPRSWYEAAFELVARQAGARQVVHHFQTNAVLVDKDWCTFFLRHRVRVGVSVDGPQALHDLHRRGRDGRGTHARVMQGIARLRAAAIPFHAIAVLTREGLDQADAIFDFFAHLGAFEVGFNVEEVEDGHGTSSLQTPEAAPAVRRFWQRVLARLETEPAGLRVREVQGVLAALRDLGFGQRMGNAQNQAGHILNVGHDGRFCFWSPELLGSVHPQRGELQLGRLGGVQDVDWTTLGRQVALRAWQAEIDQGVSRCRAECAYFRLCLGGAPANKLAELGTMAGSETMACRLGLQAVADVVLHALDTQLDKPPNG
jgi:uncharacterized protein